MADSKFMLMSKTVIGALMVIVAPLLNKYLGTHIDLALQTEVSDMLTMIITQAGAVLALYGRVKATKQLTLLP